MDDKNRCIHAPMSKVGGVSYDQDAMYIDIPDWKLQYSQKGAGNAAAHAMLGVQAGANAPRSSVGRFRQEYPDGALFRIIAFEPSPRWVAAFAREMPDVELLPYAVGLANSTSTWQ